MIRVLDIPLTYPSYMTSCWITDELLADGEHAYVLHWTTYAPGVHERALSVSEVLEYQGMEVSRGEQ